MPNETADIVDRVVRTVDHQTTPMQPDQVPAHKIVLVLGVHGNKSPSRVREALDEAVSEGRLERDEESVWIPE